MRGDRLLGLQMPTHYSDREIDIFLKGIAHAIQIAETRPDRVSIMRAMKNEWTSLSLRQEQKIERRKTNA